MLNTYITLVAGVIAAFLINRLSTTINNYYLHPLARFPGPLAVSTGWFQTIQEVFLGRNWLDVLRELHEKYGDVVRVGPNELHFSKPETYHEIYNNGIRWDKEKTLYHSFGEDRSSFGFLKYKEAKQRRDVITPLFSKRAISNLQGVIKGNCDRLCEALAKANKEGKSSDMLFGLRCYTLDTMMMFCFAKDVKATEAPGFQSPIIIAMDASLPAFIVFRNFPPLRKLVFSFPGWLTKLTNPILGGLVDLQRLLGAQVTEVVKNPKSLEATSNPTIYHRLLDPELNKAAGVPSAGSLYEEAQALTFGGVDTTANSILMATYYIIQDPAISKKLKNELRSIWPDLQRPPGVDELEKLPYLNAIIKEALRTAPSVVSPLPRVVPDAGATISGKQIPAKTVVGMSLHFVHWSAEVFETPEKFDPERWLQPDSASLERWLVAFSRGPRSCLGQNLGMAELSMAFANLFRRFDLELDETKPQDMTFKDAFSPAFNPKHMRAFCRPVKD